MVSIDIDKTRQLHFGLAALRDLENGLGGRPLGSLLQDLSGVGINVLVLAMYHGLKQDDPTLNPKLVEKKLEEHLKNGGSLGPLYDALSEALMETGVFRTAGGDAEGKSQTPVQA